MSASIHRLKVWPTYWSLIDDNVKTFEIRKNDRNFKVGDYLVLDEWNPNQAPGYLAGHYTPKEALVRIITYILVGGQFGLEEGYVVLQMEALRPGDLERVILSLAPNRPHSPA